MTLKVNIYIFGLHMVKNVPVFLYTVTMLIFQIISSEKWFNYVVTSFSFFQNAETLGQADDAKWRKKRGWPYP